jgi:hypothetical protein
MGPRKKLHIKKAIYYTSMGPYTTHQRGIYYTSEGHILHIKGAIYYTSGGAYTTHQGAHIENPRTILSTISFSGICGVVTACRWLWVSSGAKVLGEAKN